MEKIEKEVEWLSDSALSWVIEQIQIENGEHRKAWALADHESGIVHHNYISDTDFIVELIQNERPVSITSDINGDFCVFWRKDSTSVTSVSFRTAVLRAYAKHVLGNTVLIPANLY